MEYYSQELYHYGIKGMKWGKRKAKEAIVDRYKRTKQQFADSQTNRTSAKNNAVTHLKRAAMTYGVGAAAAGAAGYAARKLANRGSHTAARSMVTIGRVTMQSARILALADVGMASAHAVLGVRAQKAGAEVKQ